MEKADAKIRIAIDAMGGDNAPFSVVAGTVMGLRVAPPGAQLILVGNRQRIVAELERLHAERLPIEIVDASEEIEMGEEPASAIRRKKQSSINVGLNLQKDGRADAFISAGNTGAVMAASLLTLGRIEGVDRPAIAQYLPTEEGVALMLDVGANSDCKAHQLFQFGIMGAIYSKYVMKIRNPKVGLLSIGEERSKGNELTIASHKLLDSSGLNFCGNVEGRDILKGTADVVVCDGFVGNIVLKFAESVEGFFWNLLRKTIRGNLFANIGALLMKPAFKSFKQSLDYAEYGGAPLLGINGVCIICHGKSSPKAIMNAILVAIDVVNKQVNKVIQEKLRENGNAVEQMVKKENKSLL
jgi:phosphate acyltransferase